MRMGKVLFFCLLLLCISVPVFAQETMRDSCRIGVTVDLASDQKLPEKTITVVPGNCVRVILYASGGTGYSWELQEEDVNLFSKKVQPLKQDGLLGGPEVTTFVFKIGEEDSLPRTIHFELKRPWEKGLPPAQSFQLIMFAENPPETEVVEPDAVIEE